MALVAVLEVPFVHYQAEHMFWMGMEDPDRSPLPFRAEGQFRVGAAPHLEYGDPTLMPIAVPVQNLLLERPGRYSFTFGIDRDRELGRYEIRALQIAIPLQFDFRPPESQAG